MDIGGGSTEFIVGAGFEPLERESLQMGCIATTRRFFADGKLSQQALEGRPHRDHRRVPAVRSTYRTLGWQEAIGSSGTIKAIGEICAAMKLTNGAITAEALAEIRERLLAVRPHRGHPAAGPVRPIAGR